MSSLGLLEAKKRSTLKNVYLLTKSKNNLSILGVNNIFTFFISDFLRLFLEVKGRYLLFF